MENGKKLEMFGNFYTISELKEYLCDVNSVAGVKPYTLSDGPEKGVRAIDIWTGSGLEYTVVPDKGMNICRFRYKGIPFDWASGTGLTSPFLYDSHTWKWVRSFNGGLLFTCGLNNVGDPCIDGEEDYGSHGRIGNTPASRISWNVDTENAPYRIEVTGRCRLVSVMGENLLLERKIISEIAGKTIIVKDRVKNLGFEKTPVFLLYHCNFGFPLLSPDSILTIPAQKATAEGSGKDVPDFKEIYSPIDQGGEQVIYPKVTGDPVKISLFNPKLGENGLGIYIKYTRKELPYLTMWKFFQKRGYVLGIEPGTCQVKGRVLEKENGHAVLLDADQSLSITVEFGVITKN